MKKVSSRNLSLKEEVNGRINAEEEKEILSILGIKKMIKIIIIKGGFVIKCN